MTDFFERLLGEIITGVIALPTGAAVEALWVRSRNQRRARPIVELFGLKTGPVKIVHSSIHDDKRDADNYPAADSRASRLLGSLLNRAHRREGEGFTVVADVDVTKGHRVDPSLWKQNVILLCGPKRNPVVADALARLPKSLKYTMSVDTITERTLLHDNMRNHWLKSSEDEEASGDTADGNYDYGLILSAENPFHADATVTILAGLHGTGTLGCADFLMDTENIKKLLSRRMNGIVCEVIKVSYGDRYEEILDTDLA
jgi:hypothetical protein